MDIKCLHLSDQFYSFLNPYMGSRMASSHAQQPYYPWISSATIPRLAEQVWPLMPLHVCNFFSSPLLLLILFHSLPSPSNSFPPVPSLYLSFISSSPLFLFTSDFLFFYRSSLHTPSCCSKSLKGTELVGAVAMAMEAMALPVGSLGWADCTKTQQADAQTLVFVQILSCQSSDWKGVGGRKSNAPRADGK